MHRKIFISGGLLTITAVASTALAQAPVSADDVVDNISLTVPVSCSLSGTNLTQTAQIRNGIFTEDIGSASIKATCTDTAGFAIYAVGYTGNTYGNNKMHSNDLSTDYDIPTGKYVQGTTTDSVWSMKLIPATGTYAPIIRDDSSYDYTDYEVVPSEEIKVAYRDSGTDYGEGSIGANFSTRYAVYADLEQPAGEYTAQVKFTIVHPSSAPAPNP